MLSHDQLLLFWLQLVALLAVARGLGGLLRRVGQPAVVGELAAGLVLGPSVFGQLAPAAQGWLFPDDPVQTGMLGAVGWVGALLLLIVTGYETDLRLIRRLGAATARVSIASLVIPVLAGVGVGYAMPEGFLGPGAERSVFALFMGVALGISALPVIAKVLSDLDLMRRNVAQIILAAAMANDLAGWVLLGVVSGLAQSGSVALGDLAVTTIGLALFLAFAFGPGQRLVDAALRGVRVRRSGALGAGGVVVLTGLAAGAITQGLGLEAVFGAFIAGILLGRSRYQEHEAFSAVHTLTTAFLAPLFFASAGLRVDLALLADREVWTWGLVVLAAASVSKLVGAWIGAWLAGLPGRERLALGAGLNARGAVEIVVATVGLTIGVLSPASYTVVVLMAMATSMMAPPLLRWALAGWKGSREERERLDRERVLGSNVLVRPLPILLPSHGGPNSVLAARLLDLAWPDEAEAVVLSVGGDAPEADVQRVAKAFTRRVARREKTRGGDRLGAILDHAALGFGVIALGATDARVAGRLVSPLVDDLLSASPLPVVMVRGGAAAPASEDGELAIRRILVPCRRHPARPRRAGDGVRPGGAARRRGGDRPRRDRAHPRAGGGAARLAARHDGRRARRRAHRGGRAGGGGGARPRGGAGRHGAHGDPHGPVRAGRPAGAGPRRADRPDRARRQPAPALGPSLPRPRRRVPARAERLRRGGGHRAAGLRAMTGRTLALTAAALLVPALWGWVVPALLAADLAEAPAPARAPPAAGLRDLGWKPSRSRTCWSCWPSASAPARSAPWWAPGAAS
jgi:Kef-type K+ transport system membrane component KefB